MNENKIWRERRRKISIMHHSKLDSDLTRKWGRWRHWVKYKGSGSDGERVARSKWESDICKARINIWIDAGWAGQPRSGPGKHRIIIIEADFCCPVILWHRVRVTRPRARQNMYHLSQHKLITPGVMSLVLPSDATFPISSGIRFRNEWLRPTPDFISWHPLLHFHNLNIEDVSMPGYQWLCWLAILMFLSSPRSTFRNTRCGSDDWQLRSWWYQALLWRYCRAMLWRLEM